MILIDRITSHRYKAYALVCLVGLAMMHGLVAENFVAGLESVIHAWHHEGPSVIDRERLGLFLFGAIGFAGFSWFLYAIRHRLIDITARVDRQDGPDPHYSLILTLSPLSFQRVLPDYTQDNPGTTNSDAKNALRRLMLQTTKETDPQSDQERLALLRRMTRWFDNDPTHTDRFAFGCNWQQPLRVVLHELEKETNSQLRLESITMVCTPEVEHFWDDWEALVSPLLGEGRAMVKYVLRSEEGDFHGRFQEYASLIEKDLHTANKKKRRICFDLTGGTVEQSIAAAMSTLNRKMSFCYVTNGKIDAAAPERSKPPTPYFYDLSFRGEEIGG